MVSSCIRPVREAVGSAYWQQELRNLSVYLFRFAAYKRHVFIFHERHSKFHTVDMLITLKMFLKMFTLHPWKVQRNIPIKAAIACLKTFLCILTSNFSLSKETKYWTVWICLLPFRQRAAFSYSVTQLQISKYLSINSRAFLVWQFCSIKSCHSHGVYTPCPLPLLQAKGVNCNYP
jgi:hypothetical protein